MNHIPTGPEKETHCEIFQEKCKEFLKLSWSNTGTGCPEKLWDVRLWK